MTISTLNLSTLSQALDTPVTSSASPATSASDSFAATLAQAANEMSASEGLVADPAPGTTLFSQALSEDGDALGTTTGLASSGGSDNEISLLSQLLSSSDTSSSSSSSALSDELALLSGSSASTPASTQAATTSTAVTGQDVVAKAASFEGTPYVWGGTSPTGFDCSGLTQYVYGQLGVSLPRTSEEQATVGTAVGSLADAEPGDLIFFAGSDGTSTSPGHVGIYVGNGEMIDAPYTGTTVQEQSVSTAGPVVAIRRILPSDSSTPSAAVTMGNVTVPGAYATTITAAASANNIPPALLASLLQHESGFNPSAVSSAGAQGIAQIMPSTAAGLGINALDPTQAINAAAHLLGAYTQRFGSYADALAAYNAGPNAVAEYGGIPPYAQTQAYVPEVLSSAGLSESESTAS